jgi:hypothetical protein
MEIIKVENKKETILKQIELCKSTSKIYCGYYTSVKDINKKIILLYNALKVFLKIK